MSNPNERPIEKDGITFPPFAPKLKLERRPMDKWAANLAEERTRLEGEQGALREREQNLQKEEERLRKIEQQFPPRDEPAAAPAPKSLTAVPFQRPGSAEPFANDPALRSGWDQLHRARALFESEQEGLRRDRAGLRQFAEKLKIQEAKLEAREESLAVREQAIAEREAALAAATPPPEVEPAPAEDSAVARLTKAPFAIARSVLGPKK